MKQYKVLVVLLILAVYLTACAGPATGPEVVATEAGGDTAPAQAGFVDVPREQTVIFETIDGRVALPENMNPYISGQYLDWGMWQANQESLFYLNYETGELVPWQASGYTFNADYTEVTVNIRDGVKWSDGKPFSADDVVFTINMLKANPELQYSSEMSQWVKDVVAKDAQTVVITLTSPNPRFIESFFSVRIWDTILIAPKHIWEDKDPKTFSNFDLEKGWPVGTGPYKLVRSTETETVFDLMDNWWAADTGFAKMPAPKRAIWVGIGTEEIRAAKMVNNELDAAWLFSRGTFEQAVSKNPNIIGWTKSLPYAYQDACPRFLALNDAVAPFDNAEVRWSLNAALNRDQIIAIAYEGMTEPAATLYPTYPLLKSYLDRNNQLFEEYPVLKYDPTKVDATMTGLGYAKDNEGMWVKDGKRITFTIITRAGEQDKVKMGPVIVDQMRSAGFDVDFQPLEAAVYYDDVSKGTATAWITDICGSVNDPYNTMARFHSRFYTELGQPSLSLDGFRYKNPDLDKLIDQMAGMKSDDPAYAKIADEALRLWVKDLPVIPLVQAYLLAPFSNTYWTNWPTSDNNYVQPGHWWVTGNMILLNIKPAK